MNDGKTPQTDAYFETFRTAAGLSEADYDLVFFGDSPAMNDELCDLVLAGTKRATAMLLRDVTDAGEPMPTVGGHFVVADGACRPRCVCRTTEIAIKPLNETDAAFAFDEGEGDRTLAWWLDAHRDYFTRQAAREGFEMNDRIETVLERFIVVWPPDLADSGA